MLFKKTNNKYFAEFHLLCTFICGVQYNTVVNSSAFILDILLKNFYCTEQINISGEGCWNIRVSDPHPATPVLPHSTQHNRWACTILYQCQIPAQQPQSYFIQFSIIGGHSQYFFFFLCFWALPFIRTTVFL